MMGADFHVAGDSTAVAPKQYIKGNPPPRRSLLVLVALGLVALGLIVLPRPTLFYPHIVIDVTGGVRLDFMLNGRQDETACESAATSLLNAIAATCRDCSIQSQTCIRNPAFELMRRFDETPLDLPSARMATGIVTYKSMQPEIALLACRESEREAAKKGDKSSIICYPAGAQRYRTAAEKQQDQASHTTFTVLLTIVGILIASLLAAIAFTYAQDRRELARRSNTPARICRRPIHPLLQKSTLAAVDALVLLSTFLAFAWPAAGDLNRWSRVDRTSVIGHGLIIILTIGWFWLWLEHYSRRRPFWDELREIFRVLAVMFMVSGAAAFVAGLETGRGGAIMAWALNFALIPLGRLGTRELFEDLDLWRLPAVIIGAGENAHRTYDAVNNDVCMGYRVVAFLRPSGADTKADAVGIARYPEECLDLDVPDASSLKILLREFGNPIVIFAPDDITDKHVAALVDSVAATNAHFHIIPALPALPLLNAALSPFLNRELALLTFRSNLNKRSYQWLKRIFDLMLAIPGVVLATPIIIVFFLLVFAISPGNPFFAQRREGHRGKDIYIWKLRTMYQDADRLLERHLAAHPDARLEWQRFFKLSKDPRVLPFIGNFLRRSSIDELPQLWNVITGDLSLVGPRPFPHYHLDSFSEAFRALRRGVKPGITGLWQISARSNGDVKLQEYFDTYYIRNWAIWLDLYILWRTIDAVIFGKGAR